MSKRWMITAGFCVAALVAWKGWSWWQERGIPPVENADGTIDYTLVDHSVRYYDENGKLLKRREDWVLRFPKDVFIDRPEDWGRGSRMSINGVSLKDWDANQWLYFHLDLPSLELSTNVENKFDGSTVRVLFYDQEYYNVKKNRANVGGYARSFHLRYKLYCAIDNQVVEGVHKLRNATRIEFSENRKVLLAGGFISGTYNSHYDCHRGDNSDVYSIEINGKGVGGGCRKNREYCRIAIWLPVNRLATLYLNRQYLSSLPEIYNRVVEIVDEATVREKSNIDWENDKTWLTQ